MDIRSVFAKLQKLFSANRYLIVIIIAGIVILMLPSGGEKKENIPDTKPQSFDAEGLERRIEEILESGAGVGRVDVALTMKTGMEYVYAEETKLNTREQKDDGDTKDVNRDSDRRPSILSDGNGGEAPVVVKTIYPEFLGAAVVCDGADNPKVRMYITDVISSLTGITSDRITVIKMKN